MTCRYAENSSYFSIIAESATGQFSGGTEARLPFLRFHGAQSASVGHLLSACFYSEKCWRGTLRAQTWALYGHLADCPWATAEGGGRNSEGGNASLTNGPLTTDTQVPLSGLSSSGRPTVNSTDVYGTMNACRRMLKFLRSALCILHSAFFICKIDAPGVACAHARSIRSRKAEFSILTSAHDGRMALRASSFSKIIPRGSPAQVFARRDHKSQRFSSNTCARLVQRTWRGALSDRAMRPAWPTGNSPGRDTRLYPCTGLSGHQRRVPMTTTGLTAGAIFCRPFRAWNRRGAACTK